MDSSEIEDPKDHIQSSVQASTWENQAYGFLNGHIQTSLLSYRD